MFTSLLLIATTAGVQPEDRAALTGQPVALAVQPAAVTLTGPRAGQQLLVTGRYADGTLRDLTGACDYEIDRPEVVSIQTGGYVIGQQDGVATIRVRAGGKSAQLSVEVKDFAKSEPISFRRQVMGVLSTAGCNDIRCHGAPSGKNGFRLSLWAFDPADDHIRLTRDALGRRTDPHEPDASLILQKATGRLPHEGGVRFTAHSFEANLLRRWMAEGLRDDPPAAVRQVQVSPAQRVLTAPARTQQLSVQAAFIDGSVRDVTRLTAFSSTDKAIAQVGLTGLVEFHQQGEVAILCRYLDQLVTVRLSHLAPRPGFHWPSPPENNYVDRQVFAKLKLLNIAPSDLCTDAEFIRRVFLDACGILPTPCSTAPNTPTSGP